MRRHRSSERVCSTECAPLTAMKDQNWSNRFANTLTSETVRGKHHDTDDSDDANTG
jgi:hypothetical protein